MDNLSRREREIMDIVYRLLPVSAGTIQDEMASPPSYSAVRAALATLVEKGHLQIEPEGRRYLYRPTVPRETARVSALGRVVESFFGGSAVEAALALVEAENVSAEELDALEQAIERARREGR